MTALSHCYACDHSATADEPGDFRYRASDDYVPQWPRIDRMVKNIKFDLVFGGLILLNCFLIALQAAAPASRSIASSGTCS